MELVCVSEIVGPVLRLLAEAGVQGEALHPVPRPQQVVPVQQLCHELGVLEVWLVHVTQRKISPQL